MRAGVLGWIEDGVYGTRLGGEAVALPDRCVAVEIDLDGAGVGSFGISSGVSIAVCEWMIYRSVLWFATNEGRAERKRTWSCGPREQKRPLEVGTNLRATDDGIRARCRIVRAYERTVEVDADEEAVR